MLRLRLYRQSISKNQQACDETQKSSSGLENMDSLDPTAQTSKTSDIFLKPRCEKNRWKEYDLNFDL